MTKAIEEGMFFSLPVDEMLQLNSVKMSNFNSDKLDFIAKVPDLADPFLDQWQAKTDSLITIDSDSDYTDKQMLMTHELNDLMVTARDKLQTIFFYVDRAFPNDASIISYFGKDKYNKARRYPLKLIDLILKVIEASNDVNYKDALLAKGLTQSILTDIKNTTDKLDAKNKERNNYMSGRKNCTQKRIKILNEIWGFMSAVCDASKEVYKTDYAKQQQYLLYPPKQKAKEYNNAKPEAQ